jgi:hypothetical protein
MAPHGAESALKHVKEDIRPRSPGNISGKPPSSWPRGDAQHKRSAMGWRKRQELKPDRAKRAASQRGVNIRAMRMRR